MAQLPVRLRCPVSLDFAQSLRARALDLTNVESNGFSAFISAYLTWVDTSLGLLKPAITAPDLERMFRTDVYWRMLTMERRSESDAVIRREISRLREMLTELAEAVDKAHRRWVKLHRQLVMPDTNVLVHHPSPLESLKWHKLCALAASEACEIVVPLVVIDELERQKDRGQGDAKTQARKIVHALVTLFAPHPDDPLVELESCRVPDGQPVRISVLMESFGHERLPRHDDELIRQALMLKDLAGRQVTIATGDAGVVLRARTAGLRVAHIADWTAPDSATIYG